MEPSSSTESLDVFSQSVADLDPDAEVSADEEEWLIIRSRQIVQCPPCPMRGVKNRRLGGRKDDNVTETEGDQALTEAEDEEATGAVGGLLPEIEIRGVQEHEFNSTVSSDKEKLRKERKRR